MVDEALRVRRLEVIEEHFRSEVDQEFDRTLATFGEDGHPHYEIVATGQVFDGADEVMEYYRTTRTALGSTAEPSSAISFSAPASMQETESQTRMVSAGGGVSPSLTMSKWS